MNEYVNYSVIYIRMISLRKDIQYLTVINVAVHINNLYKGNVH